MSTVAVHNAFLSSFVDQCWQHVPVIFNGELARHSIANGELARPLT